MFGFGIIMVMFLSAINANPDVALIFFTPISLFVFWINLSLTTRRLHDIGYSGFWQLLYLVPILNLLAGLVINLACFAEKGSKGSNKYGDFSYKIF